MPLNLHTVEAEFLPWHRSGVQLGPWCFEWSATNHIHTVKARIQDICLY